MTIEKKFRANDNVGIKRSCLKTFYININNIKSGIVEWDSMRYRFQPEQSLLVALKKKDSVKCVVSLQVYHSGDKVAVCRVHRDTISGNSLVAQLKEALS